MLRIFLFNSLLLCANLSFGQDVENDKVESYLGQFSYYEYLDWDSAKMYLDSASLVLEESTDNNLLGKINLYKGWYFQDISEFDSSRTYFYKALDYYTLANNYNKIADTYGNLGNAYHDIGDLKKALDYQLLSLETNEKIIMLSKDEQSIESAIRGRAYAWSNISTVYRILGQHAKSLEYERQAMKYELEKGDDSIGLGISYINMGTAYDNLHESDSAYHYISMAHGIFTRQSFSNGLISSNIFLFKHSKKEGSPDVKFLEDAHQITRDFEDHHSEVIVLGHLISGDFGYSNDSLQKMVNRGNKLIKDYDFENSQFDFYRHVAIYNSKQGDFKKAYANLNKYIQLYQGQKEKNDGVDFENAELRHEYQLQSLEDSIAFEKTLAHHQLEDQKRHERQSLIITIAIGGGLVMAVFLIFVIRALIVRKRTNRQLNEKNIQIESQKVLVEEKNQEIFDSITYAKRLQNAILPQIDHIQNEFSDSFVLYEPKDVVSGDFYWFEKKGDLTFIAAADCTGHGVPGAMVSVVCSNALHQALNEFDLTSTSDILNKTRELVIATFAKSGDNVKDGMDICLCCFNQKEQNVQFSGANNSLWIMRNNENLSPEEKEEKSTILGPEYSLIEIKPNKQPIGLYAEMEDFTSHNISVMPGDEFILFTDGYADQFGGDKGKKLKYKTLKQLLLDNVHDSCEAQQKRLQEFLYDWIGDLEQVDDICIIGLKI